MQNENKKIFFIGLIQVKEEEWTGFSSGWQGCSEGFTEGGWKLLCLVLNNATRPIQIWPFCLESHSGKGLLWI